MYADDADFKFDIVQYYEEIAEAKPRSRFHFYASKVFGGQTIKIVRIGTNGSVELVQSKNCNVLCMKRL